MIKDATGTALTVRSSGAKSSRVLLYREDKAAKTVPVRAARKNPVKIRPRENKIDCQKERYAASCKSRLITESGETRDVFLLCRPYYGR